MKKAVSLLLILALSLALSGCGEQTSKPSPVGGNTITDGSGAILMIPEKNTEATLASVYAVSVPFIVSLGLSDRVKAINVKSAFWTDNVPALATAGSIGRGVVDLEALAELSPDVLIHRSNDSKAVESVSKLGIAVLCINAEDLADIKNTLTMMGKYFGVSDRAEEVCRWIDDKFTYIESVVATIPPDERVTALVLGGSLGRIAAGDMLQSWMIEKAGGICVANGVAVDHNWTDVGVETIFNWNPDFIFCTGSTGLDYSTEGIYADPAWSAVSAVAGRHVYRIPAARDAWDMPGISCVLGTMYMLHQMYPNYFSAAELQAQIDDYYCFMFGKTFEANYLGYDMEN